MELGKTLASALVPHDFAYGGSPLEMPAALAALVHTAEASTLLLLVLILN